MGRVFIIRQPTLAGKSMKIPHWPIMAHLYNRTNHFAQGFPYINSQLCWPKTSGIDCSSGCHRATWRPHRWRWRPRYFAVRGLPGWLKLWKGPCSTAPKLHQSYIASFFPWYNLVQLLQGVILSLPFSPRVHLNFVPFSIESQPCAGDWPPFHNQKNMRCFLIPWLALKDTLQETRKPLNSRENQVFPIDVPLNQSTDASTIFTLPPC